MRGEKDDPLHGVCRFHTCFNQLEVSSMWYLDKVKAEDLASECVVEILGSDSKWKEVKLVKFTLQEGSSLAQIEYRSLSEHSGQVCASSANCSSGYLEGVRPSYRWFSQTLRSCVAQTQ